ncbi:MAG TPA: NADH:flavin oxidoreductase [Streptosporangiaceae bacterium]|nr:NADH:flavin oxidoreductase [Streptosporangiaceae bacterium]
MPADPFGPARLGPVQLRNRVLKAATFEGMSPANVVSGSLVDFHRRFAAGGVAMTTVSYVAVSPDGRGAPNEIYIHKAAADGLSRIADAVHAEGAAISAQLGHAGAVGTTRKRYLGPSATRTIAGTRVHEISPAGIDAVVGDFGRGARMLADAGFDAVELHFGHHYLVSAFLSPKWNRRTDEYGGPVANRARLPIRILHAVRGQVGTAMAVTAKLNMADGIRGGLQVGDSVEIARLLAAEGILDAIELSAGGSQANQMFMFRGDPPRKEMMAALALPGVQGIGFRLASRMLFRSYPYQDAYLLPLARQFRAALSLPLILLGGITSVASIELAMAEGFDFVAMGRALLREPDLVARMAAGSASAGTCVHCNKCIPSIYSGTRCVLDHPDPLSVIALR